MTLLFAAKAMRLWGWPFFMPASVPDGDSFLGYMAGVLDLLKTGQKGLFVQGARKTGQSMTRVVSHSNVFVSALVFGGKPRMILAMAEAGAFDLAGFSSYSLSVS